jgi:hypothetical protein
MPNELTRIITLTVVALKTCCGRRNSVSENAIYSRDCLEVIDNNWQCTPLLPAARKEKLLKVRLLMSVFVFWVVTLWTRRLIPTFQRNTVSIFLQNVGIYLQVHMASQPRRTTLTSSWS